MEFVRYGIAMLAIALAGTAAAQTTIPLVFTAGYGIIQNVVDNGTQVTLQTTVDTNIVQTIQKAQGGSELLCASTGGTSTAYSCFMSPTIGSLTTGMVLNWQPNVNGAGGATTLTVDGTGPNALKLADGITNPSASTIVSGQLYAIWYDGANFRIMSGGGGGCNISGGTAYYSPFAWVGTGGYAASNGQQVAIELFTPTCTVQFSNVAFEVLTPSGTACSGGVCGLAFGIYDTSGNRISQTVAVAGGTPDINTTGWKNLGWGSTVTLAAGTPYYMAYYSDSATLQILKSDVNGSADFESALNAYSGIVSIGFAGNGATGDGASLSLPATLGSSSSLINNYSCAPAVVLR